MRSTTHFQLTLGAQSLGDGRTRFRVWAPRRKSVDVALHESGGLRYLPLEKTAGGYFEGTHAAPVGALYKYREWYGMGERANVGLKLPASLVAEGVLARERGEPVRYGVADPSIFANNGGPSIAEMMLVPGCHWLRGDNAREAGWEQLRKRLDSSPPLIYFHHSCVHTIRTLSAIQHDKKDPEDVDTEAEDHAADETRYACMSRVWVEDLPVEQDRLRFPKLPGQMTIGELVARYDRKQKAEVW